MAPSLASAFSAGHGLLTTLACLLMCHSKFFMCGLAEAIDADTVAIKPQKIDERMALNGGGYK